MKTKNKIPMRQCTGCREMKNKKEMIRVLKTAEDEIVLDVTGKKNGQFALTPGRITVPAAAYTQDAETGAWITEPGVSILTISGTV